MNIDGITPDGRVYEQKVYPAGKKAGKHSQLIRYAFGAMHSGIKVGYWTKRGLITIEPVPHGS